MSLHRQKPPEKGTITIEILSELDRDKHIFLQMLDLHRQKVAPVDLTSMLYISAPCLQDQFPQNPTELADAFLRRLWLYGPQARNSSCEVVAGDYGVARPLEMDEDSKCAINPLDLVAAVYMTANSFLQQEITHRMMQCNFAVPLYLPPVYPEKKGTVILWPFRGVLSKWKSPTLSDSRCNMKNMADSRMTFLSALRLGNCSVSKSRVLNKVLGGSHVANECFVNRDTDGGQLPRVLSDGLVEMSWNLTPRDHHDSVFPKPILMANLRGDAADCEKQVSLLCYASAVLIVFCGSFGMEERKLLAAWRDNASHLILIDCSLDMEVDGEENRSESMKQLLVKELELSEEFLINGQDGDEEALSERLRDVLCRLVPHLHTTSLVATAGMASDLDMKVDEDEVCRMAFIEVEEIINGIENGVSQFLEEQLPLQGHVSKGLCHVDKETKEDFQSPYSSHQTTEGNEGHVDAFMSYKLTTAMKSFIESLCTYDTTKRAFFLCWMRVKLQVMQLEKLSNSRQEQQLELCIGLEHFLREMGYIYERYFRGPNYDLYEMFRLPYVAAELLLYGVPLEIYDGDASEFPLNWVYSVLYEVYRQLPQNSRMRVLTTLGFQCSKNPEILSSMFGVNFPKCGQRHIKGAYLLFLTLPDNIRMEIDCEYLMLICTEGLNPSPNKSKQGERSFLHDNELATFVSRLSDITLVHFPQEGQATATNNLQIAVNALLHTKEAEKRPSFQVVSEGPVKEAKIMSCVIHVLSQEKCLNEAEIELQSNEKESIYHDLQGPWTNKLTEEADKTYSDAALRLKRSLLSVFHEKGQPTCLGAFMEHMCNVWESVKNQNVVIEFGDANGADALIGLCTKLVEGEQQLMNVMDQWVEEMDNRITELKESALSNGHQYDEIDGIARILEEETAVQIHLESEKMKASLWEHFRQEDIDTAHMETYKANLLKRVQSIQQQVTDDMNPRIETAIVRHDMSDKMQALLTALEAALEVRLRSLLESCKNNDTVITNKQLGEEFEKVWNDIPSNLDFKPFETCDVRTGMAEQLKDNLHSRGVKKQKIKLKNTNQLKGFTVKNDHFALSSKMKRALKYYKEVAQRFVNNLIEDCEIRVSEKLKHKEGYSDSYMRELLAIVDKGFEVLKMEPFVMKPKFEVDLKIYICSKAAVSFQEMHDLLKRQRETKEKFLNETKEKHLKDFMFDFRKRAQCQKAAQTFTSMCLRPTALDFIYSSLEKQILEDMMASDQAQIYSSSKNFHYHLLKDLLLEDCFENFHEYLLSHEKFCRKKIEDIIMDRLSGSMMIEDRREQRMQQVCQRMETSIRLASEDGSGVQNARALLKGICCTIETPGDVKVPQECLRGPLFEINSHREHFIAYLEESVNELSESIFQEFRENEDVIEVPDDLSYKLQDLLYDRVKGCDKHCPFCKAPCDLGGEDHAVHEALVHRPKGLVCYTDADSVSLSHISCSADVAGENHFQNRHTDGQKILYKNYQSIYPDWNIPPERPGAPGNGTYWKHVLTRYNTRFAQVYQCESASPPADWKNITKEMALKSLKDVFSITE